MKVLKYFLCIVALGVLLVECGKPVTNHGWEIGRVSKTNKNTHKWAPKIISFSLLNLSEVRFNITAPYVSSASDSTPEEAIEKISELNDRARQISPKTYWYTLELNTFHQDVNWAMVISNPRIEEDVFIKEQGGNRFEKLIGSPELEPYYEEPVGRKYLLGLITLEKATILIRVSSTEPTFLKEIKIFPIDASGKKKVTNESKLGIAMGILSLVIIIFFYFFLVSKKPIHLIFILFSICQVASYLSSIYFLSWPNVWEHSRLGTILLTFILIFHGPQAQGNRKINIAFTVILILYIALDSSRITTLYFGHNWTILMRMALQLLVVYNFWDAWVNKRSVHWKLVVGMLGSLFTLFYLPISSTIFLPSQLLDNEMIIFWVYSLARIFTYVILIVLLVSKFLEFRRWQAENKISIAIQQEKDISEKVISAQEEERERISKDLHDEIGAGLALIKIKLHHLNIKHASINEIISDLNKVSSATKSIAYELMPPYFLQTDFKMLLFSYFNSINDKGNMQFHLDYKGMLNMAKTKELMLYRIILEMVQNCVKHSKAKNVDVQVDATEEMVEISCIDDGIGFSPDLKLGIGMQSMQSRVKYLNGIMQVKSGKDGTSIIVRIPK